nr:TPA_inf: conotoxin precursor J [Conus ebraeus]DAZ85990.1 TPA_inf: conotoxin precursor J [Conus ebraeus]DAZ86424.1 TPA_inf: conotoxin precursor J [Conus judaeus]
MASVQSVTCCCFLWLMLSVQLITPGSPGTAHLPRDTRDVPEIVLEFMCPVICGNGFGEEYCNCTKKRDMVSSRIRRKRSMAM